jgi:hypothetical protein
VRCGSQLCSVVGGVLVAGASMARWWVRISTPVLFSPYKPRLLGQALGVARKHVAQPRPLRAKLYGAGRGICLASAGLVRVGYLWLRLQSACPSHLCTPMLGPCSRFHTAMLPRSAPRWRKVETWPPLQNCAGVFPRSPTMQGRESGPGWSQVGSHCHQRPIAQDAGPGPPSVDIDSRRVTPASPVRWVRPGVRAWLGK